MLCHFIYRLIHSCLDTVTRIGKQCNANMDVQKDVIKSKNTNSILTVTRMHIPACYEERKQSRAEQTSVMEECKLKQTFTRQRKRERGIKRNCYPFQVNEIILQRQPTKVNLKYWLWSKRGSRGDKQSSRGINMSSGNYFLSPRYFLHRSVYSPACQWRVMRRERG